MTPEQGDGPDRGGKVLLTTHMGGKAKKHIVRWVWMYIVARVGFAFSVGCYVILRGLQSIQRIDDPTFRIPIYFVIGMGLGLLVFALVIANCGMWAFWPETVELSDTGIRIWTGDSLKEARWSDLREVKVSFTSWFSAFRVGGIPGERTAVVYLRTGSWKHALEWWRYPEAERKMAFHHIVDHVARSNVAIVDDFHWLPSQYSSYQNVSSSVKKEYSTLLWVGLGMFGIGMVLLLIVFAIGLGGQNVLSIVIGTFVTVGLFCLVAGVAGVDDEKRKGREKAQEEEYLRRMSPPGQR